MKEGVSVGPHYIVVTKFLMNYIYINRCVESVGFDLMIFIHEYLMVISSGYSDQLVFACHE